ncbi:MAG: AmiR/NasT family two-component response regulator [Cellvibrionaceae bacterium]|jgi:AmiR/NasT family two-component response regulator
MKILIADDESIIRMGLKQILTEMGHSVIAANNGREALQMARAHNPDMAILDIRMPFTDGIQAAKALAKNQPMPIILLTAFSDDDLIEKATELPIQGYLVKPVNEGALKAAISVAVKRFAETSKLKQTGAKLYIALETRKLLDKAKGKLMSDHGLSEDEAYQLMQDQARDSRQSMKEIAQAVIDG